MKKTIFLTILTIFMASLFAETKFVVNGGHFSSIVDIQYDKNNDLIFTAEEKGTIFIWDSSDDSLKSSVQVSSNTIDKILLSPSDTNVAILSHNSENYYLSVWNWFTERELFSIIIEEQPLFLKYSAKGKYLFYGRINNPSLAFINGRNGIHHSYLDTLPSVYDFGYIGNSEKNIMLYKSSGFINYYNIFTGKEIVGFDTIRGLNELSVIQTGNKGSITARQNNDIFMIDRESGKIQDTLTFNELKQFYQNKENGILLTLERSNRNWILKKWYTDNGIFTQVGSLISLTNSLEITSFISTNNVDLAGDIDGTLYKIDWDHLQLDVYSTSNRKKISDLSISDNILTLTGHDGFLMIEADFFKNNQLTISNPVFMKQDNVIDTETGLIRIENNKVLIWNKDNKKGEVQILNTDNNEFVFEYNKFDSPILDICYREEKIITLEKNGSIKILDIKKNEEIFNYTGLGFLNISIIDSTSLYIGRSSVGGRSSAIILDIETKETIPVNDNSFISFDSIAIEENKLFYSLGLVTNGIRTTTVLQSHNYQNLDDTKTLVTYTGEDMDAQVLIDPKDNSTIFAKLGNSGIYKIIGNKYLKFDNNKPIKKIYIYDSILYSLNQDNSITLYLASTGRSLYTIHIFEDDSWALVPSSSDFYFGSEGVEENILTYRNNRKVYIIPNNLQ